LNSLDFSRWYHILGVEDKKGQSKARRHKKIELQRKASKKFECYQCKNIEIYIKETLDQIRK